MFSKKQVIQGIVSLAAAGLLFSACTRNSPIQQAAREEDTMAPYININQYEFYTEVGQPIDFSNIGGYDDKDGMLPTRVRGYVDYNKAGDYYPSIVCTDLSNNESAAVITVHVVEKGKLPVSNAETPEPTPSTCGNGTDPNKPCRVVLSETVRVYKTLFEGEEGKELCESMYSEDACEVIVRNDGSFWGYGVK